VIDLFGLGFVVRLHPRYGKLKFQNLGAQMFSPQRQPFRGRRFPPPPPRSVLNLCFEVTDSETAGVLFQELFIPFLRLAKGLHRRRPVFEFYLAPGPHPKIF
jgi:hypothetical protein